MANERYLPADRVKLPTNIKFAPEGHCDWCGKELPKRCRCFCPAVRVDYMPNYFRLVSKCAEAFAQWWYSIPAYKRAVLIRDNFTCQKCGWHEMQAERPWLPETKGMECDHIIPLKRGGETIISNLQVLCGPCNREKGTRLDGEEKPTTEPKLTKRELIIVAGQLEFWR